MIIGGTLGHALCTALAVIGGKMVAQRISVKNGAFLSIHLKIYCAVNNNEVKWGRSFTLQ